MVGYSECSFCQLLYFFRLRVPLLLTVIISQEGLDRRFFPNLVVCLFLIKTSVPGVYM